MFFINNKIINILLTLSFLILFISAQSQTISGYIEDAKTGEKIIGANIYSLKTQKGTVSNNYGFYSFTTKQNTLQLNYSFIGYKTKTKDFSLTGDTTINIFLEPNIELDEILVIENKSEQIIRSSQMSIVELPMKTIKKLPVFLGETDVLKTLQLMPGVHSGNEGSSGLYVRGGGADQNLILLDGVPVYNSYHLFGFFSIFNGNAIKNIKLIKGGFPAQYGGRLSSILDIRMKEGNSKEIKGEISIGLIASKFTIEGPIKKNKTSFIFTARRTYIDILARPFIKLADENTNAGYYFYDLTGKINHKFSEKSRLYLSSYIGKDNFYSKYNYNGVSDYGQYNAKTEDYLNWGNITSALRWNYIINNKLFSNTTLTYSNFNFNTGVYSEEKTESKLENYDLSYNSGIEDISSKIDFNYIPNTENYIKFGVKHIYHIFKPGVNTEKFNSNIDSIANIDNTSGNKTIYSNEISAYFENDFKIGSMIKANIGIRYSGIYVENRYFNELEPRISTRFLLNEKVSIKASYSKMVQYLHLLTNSTIGLPTDLWLPVTENVKPQKSNQYAFGIFYNISRTFDLSIETYFKTMQNLIEYKEGASFYSSAGNWEDKIETGIGRAYGLEVLIKKNIGKTTGWIGYTLSRSERKFTNLNFNEWFPYRYDRTHDISISIIHKFNDNFDIGVNWIYGTGNAVTIAYSRFPSYFMNNNNILASTWCHFSSNLLNFEKRNSYRMPAYHRLDIGLNFYKQKKRGKRTFSFGLYNAYWRLNAYYLDYNYDNQTMEKVSLFPIMPYIKYAFKF